MSSRLRGSAIFAVLGASLALGASPAAAVTGQLTQLSGAAGCIRDAAATGPAGCATARALAGRTALAVSGDGRSVYVTAGAGAVAVFSRDAATGALTQLAGDAGCVADPQPMNPCPAG